VVLVDILAAVRHFPKVQLLGRVAWSQIPAGVNPRRRNIVTEPESNAVPLRR